MFTVRHECMNDNVAFHFGKYYDQYRGVTSSNLFQIQKEFAGFENRFPRLGTYSSDLPIYSATYSQLGNICTE